MASFYYSERYTEIDMGRGIKREFKRNFGIDGSSDEIKELLPLVFSKLPQYRYPVLQSRKDVVRLLEEE